jgi:diacylglycerol kinase (ATP)
LPLPAKTLVLVNPAAGGGRARHAQPRVADYLRRRGVRADFVAPADSAELRGRAASAAGEGYTHVVALGGDGAFHDVVNGAFGGVVLGVFPAGNGNDIAAGLGIPEDPVAAAALFLRAAPRPVDVLRARCAGAEPRLYIGAGGMGLDAEAAQLVTTRFRRLPGAARYVAAALWALTRFEPLRLEVELDGRPVPAEGGALFVAVANAPAYGAGVKIAPGARMDDGFLDVTLIGALPWTRVLEALPIVLREGPPRWPEIRRLRGRRIRLRAERPALFHGDGEVLGRSPVEVDVLHHAVRVVAPAE